MAIQVTKLGGGTWFTPAMYAKENAQGKGAVVLDILADGTLAFADYYSAAGTTWNTLSGVDEVVCKLLADGDLSFADYVAVTGSGWDTIDGISATVADLIARGVLTYAEYAEIIGLEIPEGITTDEEIENFVRIMVNGFSWAASPWADIATMLAWHYASVLDIHGYMSVGESRSVTLSAMSATGVGESHAVQTVDLVLMSADHYDLTDGSGKAAFVFQQRHSLNEMGYMNSSNTNSGGWDGSARRTWCNNVYKTALPADLQNILQQVSIVTASAGNSSSKKTSSDYIFLPAEREVFGTNQSANSTAESGLTQYSWYADSGNSKIKNVNSSAYSWWERSPNGSVTYNFCIVHSSGSASNSGADGTLGLAPCGCI